MPELSRFFGIIIRMFVKAGVFTIEPIEMIAGSLPRRQQGLVEAWAELHQHELRADWDRLQEGLPAATIEPLK